MSDVPAHAEIMDVMDFLSVERVPSRLLPGQHQLKPVFTCPKCKSRREPPATNTEITCGCGLHMRQQGMRVHIWTHADVVPLHRKDRNACQQI